jgi:hypothetical protein
MNAYKMNWEGWYRFSYTHAGTTAFLTMPYLQAITYYHTNKPGAGPIEIHRDGAWQPI